MNHKMNGQAGFTLIELIVVIVILGILAVTAAPKFMNLTSDANASVVKGLSGSIKSAYQMVYAKSRLSTSARLVCASEDCSGKDLDVGNDGIIAVTEKGYPVSSTEKLTGTNSNNIEPKMKNTIAGAVDLGVAWDAYDSLKETDASKNTADWLVLPTTDKAFVFIPKSAPTSAKTATNYENAQADGTNTCGVYYKADDKNPPTVKVYVKGC